MTAERTEPEVLAWLRGSVAELLDVRPGEVDPERPLSELGISSRDAVGLVGELEDYLDRDLDATLVWRTPTIAALARLLAVGGLDGELPEIDAGASLRYPQTPEHEPVAIIGLGARFPGGAEGHDGFWDLLRTGRDAVGTVPDGRWDPFTASSSSSFVAGLNRTGGFLADIAGFDAAHFGISPREAELMDPQQRMLLEVFVEALDHSGLDAEALRGSDTGVFVGMSTNEYSHLAAGDLDAVDAYLATGSAFSIAANRISYLFDLRGPSLTLDTACSSSLVAVHQAVRSIRAGESSTAFVAGVNLLLSPATTVTFSQAGALAPAGGCKPFSDDADGIARAEGCGVVVLKRLSDAQRDGDRVLAVVAGSAVNSDGRSNGLTAPNPQAQEAVLAAAYADAGLPMHGVDYVEAHGTGTLLGDPIEAGALGATLGAGRPPGRPLLIGSVKSNLGHPESAAGIAGVIKVVLALRHDVIPASIKYRGPNPHIRFDDWRLAVVEEPQKWPRHTGRAVAGVSGFGFGGTNAHVVIAEYVDAATNGDARQVVHDHGEGAVVLPLAGAHPSRVRDAAAALADWLDGDGRDVPPAAVASTLTRRRSPGPATAVVGGRGRAGLTGALRRFAAEQRPAPHEVAIRAVPRLGQDADRAVWVFSGFGQFWNGMGARLLVEEPAFAAAVDELEPLVAEHAGFSLRAALDGTAPAASLTAVQVATFGVQVALAALWRSYGVEPAAVVGHSVGEIPAAVVAGAISLADGVRLICVRSYLVELGERTGEGGMAVVELTEAELAGLAGDFPGVGVCVYSSTRQLTVGSADAGELARLCEHVESLGRSAFPLPVRGAAHSPMVDPYLPAFLERLGTVTGRTPSVRFVSTALAGDEQPTFDQHYWAANARNPVRFAPVVRRLAAEGHQAFLEISAHPVAGRPVSQSVAGAGSPLVLPSLRRDGDDVLTFRASALGLHRAGLAVDLDRVVPPVPQVDLPRPGWRHRRFWVEPALPVAPLGGHPLLGTHVELPEGGRHLWRADVGTARLPWLDDHRVGGAAVLPVAAYAELALAAAREVLAPDAGPAAVLLDDLALTAPMPLGEHTDVTTSLRLESPQRASVEVFARPPGAPSSTPMTRHATATVSRSDGTAEPLDLGTPDAAEPVDLYAAMRAAGHEYGPAFLGVSQARLAPDGLATARVELPPTVAPSGSRDGWTVHPVLLDVCLQTLAVSALALVDADADDDVDVPDPEAARGTLVLPVGVGRVRVLATPGPDAALATARIGLGDGDRLVGSVRVTGQDGTPLIEVHGVVLQRIDAGPPLPGAGGDGWPGPAGLAALPPAEARQLLAERLRDRVAALMGYRPEDVDPSVPLGSLGVDSLIAMRARNAVETDCGVSVPVQLLLQGASLADLGSYLAGELGLGGSEAPLPVVAVTRRDVEARDGVERWLAATWHTTTGRAPSGVTAPLATLGDRAEAVQVAAAVLDRLRSLPAAAGALPTREDLLAAPDIEAQAELVRLIIEAGGDSPVRVLAPGRSGHRPLFLFHPAGGTTSVYHPLVGGLGDGVPVYGFDRLDGLVDIDDRVTRYLEHLRQLQPAGPYRLGGWSFGGALAYRTAQRLRAGGEQVETLFMIDTILPEPSQESEADLLAGRFGRFLEYLNATYGVSVDVDLRELVSLPEQDQISTLYRLAEESGANLSPALMEHQRTSYQDARIAERYTPEQYGPGRVVLYRSTDRGLTTTIDPRYARTEDTLGWDEYCPDLEVVLVPGTHTSIIDRPQVDVMAAHLSRALSTGTSEEVAHVA